MNYYDFIHALEGIALKNELRLIMNRAPTGSGLFFYFIDDRNQTHSRSVVWNKSHEEPLSLLDKLEELAKEFRRKNG
jgi:hypothetical protein